jgi:hypothetical protein
MHAGQGRIENQASDHRFAVACRAMPDRRTRTGRALEVLASRPSARVTGAGYGSVAPLSCSALER